MPSYWNVQWLDHNGNRSYPLAEDATKTDTSGSFVLPDSFLLELYFPVHAGLAVDTTKFYLQRLSVWPTGYSLSLGYDDGSASPPVVATAIIPAATHVEYNSYALAGSGDFDDCVGKIVIGSLADINLQPAGDFTFAPAGGKLDTDTIRPMIRGISSLAITVGNQTSARIYGDVELVPGRNMQITITALGNPATGAKTQIRFDAIEGAGLTDTCECTGQAQPGPCIRTINGIPPDAHGGFTLVPGDCMAITPGTNALALQDTCSNPCCGCPELQALTQELAHFGDEALTLQNYVNNMKSQVDNMALVVLGSRLADSPCVTSP
jgi:hypothetical protein